MIKKNKKAFSLLELIVAMGVIAVIMGLGITGLVSLRTTVELQGAYSEFVENLKSLQNQGKNSTSGSLGSNSVPFMYGIFFTSTGYAFGNCDKPTSNQGSCFIDSSLAKVNTLNKNVLITSTDPSNCSGIAFVRLPGTNINVDPIIAINSNGSYNINNPILKCVYTIKHSQNNTIKTITINLKNGTITLS